MIEKMKFLSIAGPKDDIDRVVEQYLSKYEIHLENALSELKTVASLRPYTETNPYKAELQTAAGLMESYHSHLTQTSSKKLSLKEAVETVHSLDGKLQTLTKQKEELEKEADVIRNSINNVIPFANLNYNLKDILHFKYVKFRFGRMPRDYYNKFMTYIYNTIDTVIHPCMEDADYIWAVYFVPRPSATKSTPSMLPCTLSASFWPMNMKVHLRLPPTPWKAACPTSAKASALWSSRLSLPLMSRRSSWQLPTKSSVPIPPTLM